MTKSGKHYVNKTCNFFFCHYVFKKLSAAEASESVYMRERVKRYKRDWLFLIEYLNYFLPIHIFLFYSFLEAVIKLDYCILCHIQQICSSWQWKYLSKTLDNLIWWQYIYWTRMKTMWQKKRSLCTISPFSTMFLILLKMCQMHLQVVKGKHL